MSEQSQSSRPDQNVISGQDAGTRHLEDGLKQMTASCERLMAALEALKAQFEALSAKATLLAEANLEFERTVTLLRAELAEWQSVAKQQTKFPDDHST